MDNTDQMLRAVTRANERLAELGLQDVVAIVYTGGAARLLNIAGRVMMSEEGPPALACGLLVARFQIELGMLLRGGA